MGVLRQRVLNAPKCPTLFTVVKPRVNQLCSHPSCLPSVFSDSISHLDFRRPRVLLLFVPSISCCLSAPSVENAVAMTLIENMNRWTLTGRAIEHVVNDGVVSHAHFLRAVDAWGQRMDQVFDGSIRCVLEQNQRKMKKKKGKKACVIS